MLIKLTLTESEANALLGLLDAGVRATGLRAAQDAAMLAQKIHAAAKEAQAPAPPAMGG